MDIEKVKEILEPFIKEKNLELYDVSFIKEGNDLILQVLVDDKPRIDVDTLAMVNDYLSVKLDEIDKDMPEYFLEVSSPGIERELRNKDEINQNIGSYIHVEVNNMIYEGYLEDFKDDTLKIKINIKGRMKVISVLYEDVKFIRLAVKF